MRTDDLAQNFGGDLSVKRRCFEFLVPEQDLNQSDIDFLLQQVGGKGMT